MLTARRMEHLARAIYFKIYLKLFSQDFRWVTIFIFTFILIYVIVLDIPQSLLSQTLFTYLVPLAKRITVIDKQCRDQIIFLNDKFSACIQSGFSVLGLLHFSESVFIGENFNSADEKQHCNVQHLSEESLYTTYDPVLSALNIVFIQQQVIRGEKKGTPSYFSSIQHMLIMYDISESI